MKKSKIKHNDILELNLGGKKIKVIARDDCPPNMMYLINDKKLGEAMEEQVMVEKILNVGKAIKKTKRRYGKIINLQD